MSEEGKQLKASEVVMAVADLASKGKYDNVTPAVAAQMNKLFELVAQVINALEAGEKKAEEGQLALEQDEAAQAADDEEINGG